MHCRSVLTAAQLLSEGIAGQQTSGFAAGFDWAAEQLRQAGFEQLEAEVIVGDWPCHHFARAQEFALYAASRPKQFTNPSAALNHASPNHLESITFLLCWHGV